MEEQTTWKGHTFTLLVFTGIVVLCSIFFILGMLVGRAEGQKVAGAGPGGASSRNEAKAAPKVPWTRLWLHCRDKNLEKDKESPLAAPETVGQAAWRWELRRVATK